MADAFPPFIMAPNAGEWLKELKDAPNIPLYGTALGEIEDKHQPKIKPTDNSLHITLSPALRCCHSISIYLTLWAPEPVLHELAHLGEIPLEIAGKSCLISLKRSERLTQFDYYFYRKFWDNESASLTPFYETRKVIELTLSGPLKTLPEIESIDIPLNHIHPAFRHHKVQIGLPLPDCKPIQYQQFTSHKAIPTGYEYTLSRLDQNTLFVLATTEQGNTLRIDLNQLDLQQKKYRGNDKLAHYELCQRQNDSDNIATQPQELKQAHTLRQLSLPSGTDIPLKNLSRWPTGYDLESLLQTLPIVREHQITLSNISPVENLKPAQKRRIAEDRFSNYAWFLQTSDQIKRLAEAWQHIPLVSLEFSMAKSLDDLYRNNIEDYLAAYLQTYFPAALQFVNSTTLEFLSDRSTPAKP